MMDWTDRHCRYFMRLISEHAVLYTEMITTGAIIYGDAHRHLQMHEAEQPVALQLGGSNPEDLARACKIASVWSLRGSSLSKSATEYFFIPTSEDPCGYFFNRAF